MTMGKSPPKVLKTTPNSTLFLRKNRRNLKKEGIRET